MEDAALYFLWASFVAAGWSAAVYVVYALQPRLGLMSPVLRAATDPPLGGVVAVADSGPPLRSATLGGVRR